MAVAKEAFYMASNFQIAFRHGGNALHLKLFGDFDGTSAMELIYVIVKHSVSAQRIFIETDGVNDLLPFGQQVFLKTFPLYRASWQELIFTGTHGYKLDAGKPDTCVTSDSAQLINDRTPIR